MCILYRQSRGDKLQLSSQTLGQRMCPEQRFTLPGPSATLVMSIENYTPKLQLRPASVQNEMCPISRDTVTCSTSELRRVGSGTMERQIELSTHMRTFISTLSRNNTTCCKLSGGITWLTLLVQRRLIIFNCGD